MVGTATVTRGRASAFVAGEAALPNPIASPMAAVAPRASIARSGAVAVGAEQGPAGPAGTDHGYVSYFGASASIATLPGIRQQLEFAPTIQNGILPTSPFAGHVFWDGAKIRSRKVNDTAIVRLDLVSSAFVANGSIEIQLDIGGSLGVIQTVTRALKAPAGVPEHISEALTIFMGATFLSDGGGLFLETSTPSIISSVDLIIFPLTAAL